MELFVVEGESAAAAIGQVCRPGVQDVHAIQGKPMNVTRASPKAVWANDRVRLLHHRVAGTESSHLVPDYDPVDRVVLLTDGNVDGVHTKALLVALVAEVLPELIDDGRLFTIRAPEFAVSCTERSTPIFAYSNEGRRSVLNQLAERGATKLATQHYAGLASMSSDELRTAFTDPATRRLTSITEQQVAAARAALS